MSDGFYIRAIFLMSCFMFGYSLGKYFGWQ
jgi:hypothetical protein